MAQSRGLLPVRSDTTGAHPFAINPFKTSKSQLETNVRLYALLTVVALSALKSCGRCDLKVSAKGRSRPWLILALDGNDDDPLTDFEATVVLPEPEGLSSAIRHCSFWVGVPQARNRNHNTVKEIPMLNVRAELRI